MIDMFEILTKLIYQASDMPITITKKEHNDPNFMKALGYLTDDRIIEKNVNGKRSLSDVGRYIVKNKLTYYDWEKTKITSHETEMDFLKYLESKQVAHSPKINVTDFMVSNFVKPNPTSPNTTNENDNGVNFLKRLKAKKIIDYDYESLEHVNYWHVDSGDNPKIKRWFDTLHTPLYVTYTQPLLPVRLSKRKLVLKQIKYAMRLATKYGLKSLIAFWKYIVALSLVVIGVYLAINNNLEKVFYFIKSIFVK